MTDENPPSAFNWGLGGAPGAPKKPDAEEKAAPPPPPLIAPEDTKYPAPPPVGPPTAAAPPPAAPTSPAWDQPTQAYDHRAAAPPPSAPPPAAPAASWDQPTQAFDYRAPTEPAPASSIYDQLTQPYAFDSSIDGATEVLGGSPVGLPELRDEGVRPPQQGSAIDSLFGEGQFKEYDDSALPTEGLGSRASSRPREPREPMGRTQKTLLIVVGGLVGALILIGVFILGTRMPGILPKPEAKPAVTAPDKEPVAAPPRVGPVAPGTYAWNELLGTECIEPFGSPWDEEFTVVDCTTPHSAQLVSRGIFGDEPYVKYPEAEVLQSRMNLSCTAPTRVDYAAAGALSDIAVTAAYPASAEQWDSGERQYFCFLTRSSGEPLTVSLAKAPVAETAPVDSVPGVDP